MAAGEFIDSYNNKENKRKFDCIITCFFLDTANNIFMYIETIKNLLKPNGIWINYGPLLFHYSEMINEVSIELSWEEIEHLILQNKFII